MNGRWEIHDIIHGGMGSVYIVYDHQWAEPFAAKTFGDEVFARNPSSAERFIREAHAWINLDQHENIVTAKFVEVIDNKPYLFLEYVSGGDLAAWIANKRENKQEAAALEGLARYGEAIVCFQRASRLGNPSAIAAIRDCERKVRHSG